MTEKYPVSKLKRRKTSVEECKSEQHKRTAPRESIGRFAPKDLQQQPSCSKTTLADRPVVRGGGQDWWAQPSLPPLEKLWALTLQAFSAQIPESSSATEQLPELPPPLPQTCARAKRAKWRWCCLGDEVGALPERPTVEQSSPAGSASAGQPVPVAPASAVPTTETTCLSSPPGAPEVDRIWAGASDQTRGAARHQEDSDEGRDDTKRRSDDDGLSVSVPTEGAAQRCHQGGNKERRGISTATRRPASSSAMSVTADAPRARGSRRESSVAGTAATATAGVTLDAFFGSGGGAERGRGGRGGGGGGGGGGRKEVAIKQRPTDQRSGTPGPPTPSPEQQGASAGLDCCPMCLMPFPPGFSQMDCDGHLAQCLSEMNTDMVW